MDTVLISGGTSGIGLAAAAVLLERGWNVASAAAIGKKGRPPWRRCLRRTGPGISRATWPATTTAPDGRRDGFSLRRPRRSGHVGRRL